GRGVITLTMSVGGHDAHGYRGPARLPGGNDVVNDLPVVFAFAWLNVGPVEPKIDHRTGKTCSAAGAAFSAHPPLAGIGKQRVHLAKTHRLPVVLGGARQERSESHDGEKRRTENFHDLSAQLHLSGAVQQGLI